MKEPQTHRYGGRRSQVGDLYLPAGEGQWAVAVVIHGGFWRGRYDRRLMDGLCRDLARRGWAAWNLEYRRLGLLSRGGWPATFDDIASAVDHLARLNAPLDLARVIALGHSAGGHLALWAAARTSARVPVSHAVGQAAVSDLVEAHRLRLGGGVVSHLLGGAPEECPDRYELASPFALLPLGVSQLLVHGERDDIVPVSMSRRYHEAALAAGEPVELVTFPGGGHFEHIDPSSEEWATVARWLDRQR